MSPVPARMLTRQARLASLPVAAVLLAAEGAVRRAAGQDPSIVRAALRRRNAERTRRVLGGLKGGALKAGQLLSTVEAIMPADPLESWRGALTALQQDVPGLGFGEVEPVLVAELGARWRERFAVFDEVPASAASLGQVHRAVWGRSGAADGRPVAVKVQYPGVREALAADLRAVSAVSRLASLLARGVAVAPMVAELRARLVEELDYRLEGRRQAAFAAAYGPGREGADEVLVPAVVLATPRVLVSEWMDGRPLSAVALTGTRAERDRAGLLYQRFLLSGPARCGLLHTDPHPGNFRLLSDGRLGVLDFGSCLSLPGGLPREVGTLMSILSRGLASGDEAGVLRELRAAGLVLPRSEVDVRALLDYLGPMAEPARHETFCYSREWLRGQFARTNDPRDPDPAVALQLQLAPELLFTHRVWLGIVGVLSQLGACVPVRAELELWLPGWEAADAS